MRRPLRLRVVPVLLALLLALVAAPAAHPQESTPVDVRVMTFNIWLGGDVVDFGKVVEAITAARADIVGLQEAEGTAFTVVPR